MFFNQVVQIRGFLIFEEYLSLYIVCFYGLLHLYTDVFQTDFCALISMTCSDLVSFLAVSVAPGTYAMDHMAVEVVARPTGTRVVEVALTLT